MQTYLSPARSNVVLVRRTYDFLCFFLVSPGPKTVQWGKKKILKRVLRKNGCDLGQKNFRILISKGMEGPQQLSSLTQRQQRPGNKRNSRKTGFYTVSATVSLYWPLLAVTCRYFWIFEFKIACFVLNTLPTHPQSHFQQLSSLTARQTKPGNKQIQETSITSEWQW